MDNPDRTMSDERKPGIADLARRLERYRRRVEAEGRQRSLRVMDRAIEDVEDHAGRDRCRVRSPSGAQTISRQPAYGTLRIGALRSGFYMPCSNGHWPPLE